MPTMAPQRDTDVASRLPAKQRARPQPAATPAPPQPSPEPPSLTSALVLAGVVLVLSLGGAWWIAGRAPEPDDEAALAELQERLDTLSARLDTLVQQAPPQQAGDEQAGDEQAGEAEALDQAQRETREAVDALARRLAEVDGRLEQLLSTFEALREVDRRWQEAVARAHDPSAVPGPLDAPPSTTPDEPDPTPVERPDYATSLRAARADGQGALALPSADAVVPLPVVWVEGGTGKLGLDPRDPDLPERGARALLPATRFSSPPVSVEIPYGFFMGATEVTNGQYLAVLTTAGIDVRERRNQRRNYLEHLANAQGRAWFQQPVRGVTWEEAVEFCELLEAQLNRDRPAGQAAWIVRLPTELEWEFAAAGAGTEPRRYPWGSDPLNDPEDLLGEVSQAGSHLIDRTPEGIMDLAAGVSEWCWDPWVERRWRSADAWRAEADGGSEPELEAGDVPQRVVRGGSFHQSNTIALECAYRQGRLTTLRAPHVGFRVVIATAETP